MPPNPLYTTTLPLTQKSKSTHKRTLLLTFDAFGTLFHPHPPVPEQYAATAHEFGLPRELVTPHRIRTAFKDVFRAHLKQYPNYGRADVLRGRYGGPRQWWEEVIRGCFRQVLASEQELGSSGQWVPADVIGDYELPNRMIEALVNRFAGPEGYTLYEDVGPFFARMREIRTSPSPSPGRSFDRILLGVISNSDDRVPSVLKALGLRVGDMRADQDLSSMELPGFEQRRGPRNNTVDAQESHVTGAGNRLDVDLDLDLIITSYEAGKEKPNRLIFDVARRQAQLLAREEKHTHGSAPLGVANRDEWVCVHVGDDYEKDYLAAMDAGWRSYLLPRGEAPKRPAETVSSLMDLVDKLRISS